MGLRPRLLLVLLLPLLLVVGGYGLLRIRQEGAELLETERRNVAAAASAVQIAVENALRDRQLADIRRLVSEMVADQAQIERIRIVNRTLATVVSHPPAGAQGVSEERLRRVVATGRAETVFDGKSTFLHLLPLRGPRGETQGVLEIAFLSSVETRVREATRDILLRLGVMGVILALLAGLVLQRQVLTPLRKLTDSIRALGEGQPGPPLPVGRRDELGAVADAFNRMAQQLEGAHQQLVAESERALDLEHQLRRSQTLAVAGKLASGIAHEVGTPLNIISGRAEILMSTLPPDHPGRPELDVILAQSERISGIIRSLLDMVRPQKAEIQPVSLGALLEGLIPPLQHMARRQGAALRARAPENLPEVAADPGQLQQVLINLLINALEATPRGGRIAVEAREAARDGRRGVAIAVTDTGPGIAPETIGRVFEPFYTTKPAGQGTGLGLAICQDIVREHGGTLTVESPPGEGATFTLWLPEHGAEAP